ncbi:uncharacterized protein LOC135400499 [Ornithodoros turicata]|uniref:uncharacterized protein LOC135400499 n=1 Tax=Ornithodoros turicata TaxID=34597 RepID=UPI003139DAE6
MAFNPATFTPTCKKVFQKCATKAFALMKLISVIEEKWDQFVEIKCITELLDNGFPDYTRECSMNSMYGDAIRCFGKPEILDRVEADNVPLANTALVQYDILLLIYVETLCLFGQSQIFFLEIMAPLMSRQDISKLLQNWASPHDTLEVNH